MMKIIITQKLLPYLVAALVATIMVGVGESAKICEEITDLHDKCEVDCRIWCLERHKDGRSKCDKNVCYCYYESLDQNQIQRSNNNNNNVHVQDKKCNIGLGRCNDGKCDAKCCVTKCANQLLDGVGFCDTSLGPDNGLCQCQYTCFP